MRKIKPRILDCLIVVFLIFSVTVISWFVVNNPLGISRLVYFAQAATIQSFTACSSDSPDWLRELQSEGAQRLGALSSQIAYLEPNGEYHHCETGWKDGFLGDRRLESGHRFRYASATKTVTAMAVIDLVNKNKLALDAKIVDLLGLDGPFKDLRVKNITVQHLLTHTSGWDRERTQDVMFMANSQPWCPSLPEQLRATSLQYDPGATSVYSNLGYCLLGLAIEAVTEVSYRAYVSDRFNFGSNTLAFVDGPYLPDEVEYDTRHENFFTNKYFNMFDFQALSSSAGLSGNASDLAFLVKESLSWSPLTILQGESSVACDPTKIQQCYGYGLYKYHSNSDFIPLYIHGGKLPGATSAIVVDTQGGVLVWLGAGSPKLGSDAQTKFYDRVAASLTHYYE